MIRYFLIVISNSFKHCCSHQIIKNIFLLHCWSSTSFSSLKGMIHPTHPIQHLQFQETGNWESKPNPNRKSREREICRWSRNIKSDFCSKRKKLTGYMYYPGARSRVEVCLLSSIPHDTDTNMSNNKIVLSLGGGCVISPKTRAGVNCAEVSNPKATFPVDTWWYWVSMGPYWLILGGTGSVKGGTRSV